MSTVTRLHTPRTAGPPRLVLAPGAAADLESAELFLLSLDTEMADASPARLAYLIGLSEGHLLNLVQHLRAVAS
jgi:hypothetical protein